MDSQKRRRIIIQQALKLQELKEGRDSVNNRRTPSKSRILKTEHSLTAPKHTPLNQAELDDLMQRGDCKLIFLQNNIEEVGFKTFSDMMRTNSSWLTQLSPPAQLKNRLEFNHSQAVKFKHLIEKKWNSTIQEVSQNIIQKQHENKGSNKVKLVQLKISHQDVDDDNHYHQVVKEEAPSPTQELIPTNLRFFWFHVQITDWKPPIREGCTVTYLQNQNRCYMYGGIGNDLFKTFITLNTQSWAWKDIGPGVGDVPTEGRFGHTTTLYKSQLIIYGGEKKYNTAMKMRECYHDVRVFSPADKTWILVKTFGDIVEGRRNHCAECIGKFFFVYGGINSYGKVLNDICGLNLETGKWYGKCQFTRQSFLVENFVGQDGVSDATSVPLFRGEVKMENPYFSYEYSKNRKGRFAKVTDEGIYVFGGRLQNGEAVNDLRIIQFGTKPLKIMKGKTKGQPPFPRYSHSMNYYSQLNALIIYGGRNDSRAGNILNDIYVLQMENMNWIQVQQVGQLKYGKSSHCSVNIDSKILIFGGYTQNVYANADVQLIELDQNKVAKMIKDNKNNKNKEVIISSYDLVSNTNLKVFKAEYYNEAEDPDVKQKKILENEVQKLAYNNFKSFLPLPPPQISPLVQEYKLKREQAKLELLKQPTLEISRRASRKTLSEVRPISRAASKMPETIFETK